MRAGFNLLPRRCVPRATRYAEILHPGPLASSVSRPFFGSAGTVKSGKFSPREKLSMSPLFEIFDRCFLVFMPRVLHGGCVGAADKIEVLEGTRVGFRPGHRGVSMLMALGSLEPRAVSARNAP